MNIIDKGSFEDKKAITSFLFLGDSRKVIGLEDGTIEIWNAIFTICYHKVKLFNTQITHLFQDHFKINTLTIVTNHFIGLLNLKTYQCMGVLYSPNYHEIIHLPRNRIVLLKEHSFEIWYLLNFEIIGRYSSYHYISSGAKIYGSQIIIEQTDEQPYISDYHFPIKRTQNVPTQLYKYNEKIQTEYLLSKKNIDSSSHTSHISTKEDNDEVDNISSSDSEIEEENEKYNIEYTQNRIYPYVTQSMERRKTKKYTAFFPLPLSNSKDVPKDPEYATITPQPNLIPKRHFVGIFGVDQYKLKRILFRINPTNSLEYYNELNYKTRKIDIEQFPKNNILNYEYLYNKQDVYIFTNNRYEGLEYETNSCTYSIYIEIENYNLKREKRYEGNMIGLNQLLVVNVHTRELEILYSINKDNFGDKMHRLDDRSFCIVHKNTHLLILRLNTNRCIKLPKEDQAEITQVFQNKHKYLFALDCTNKIFIYELEKYSFLYNLHHDYSNILYIGNYNKNETIIIFANLDNDVKTHIYYLNY